MENCWDYFVQVPAAGRHEPLTLGLRQVSCDYDTIAWVDIPKNVRQNGVNLESASKIVTNGKPLGLFCQICGIKNTLSETSI